MVPEVGLEPTRYCYQRILSPSRLPVPSFRRKGICAPKRMPAAGKRRGACAPAVNIVAHRAVVGKKKLPLRPALPVGIQYILDRRKKEKKDRDSSGIVGVAANNCTKGDHILHGKKYNTGHGIQAITDEVCGEIRREPCEPEIQQKPLVHLLLESALGWKRGIPCLSVQTAAPSSKPAYGG